MKHQYAIDPEIQALLPPLAPDELSNLSALLIGGRSCDDLIVLHIESENKNVLGDGHNRESICRTEDIPFGTRLVNVPDRQGAIAWVIRNQLGRRNLTDERRAYYMGKEYLNAKQPHGGQLPKGVVTFTTPSQAEKIAAEHGVSEKTVRNNAAFAAACDALSEEEKERILSGQSGKTKTKVVNGRKPALILCQRCKTIGQETPATGCTKCQAERARVKAEKKAKKKKKAEQAAQPSEVIDEFKNPIPKKRLAVWSDPWIQETFDTLAICLDNLLRARIATGMNKRAKHYPFFEAKDFVDGYGFATNYIDDLIAHLRDKRPAGVCPCCEGAGCGECRNSGLVPRDLYKTLKAKAKAKETAR